MLVLHLHAACTGGELENDWTCAGSLSGTTSMVVARFKLPALACSGKVGCATQQQVTLGFGGWRRRRCELQSAHVLV